MRHVGEFHYVILNNDLCAAVDDIVAVVRAARLRYTVQHARHQIYFDFLQQD
jgi:guanylate kinase